MNDQNTITQESYDAIVAEADKLKKKLKRATQDIVMLRQVLDAIRDEHTSSHGDMEATDGALAVLDKLAHDAVNRAVNDFAPPGDVDDIPF